MRGDCHGPLDLALDGAELDERGRVVVMGDCVVGGARPPFGDQPWASCPIAEARQPAVAELLAIHRSTRDGQPLPFELTAAGADALRAATSHEAALRAWQLKRAAIERGGAT